MPENLLCPGLASVEKEVNARVLVDKIKASGNEAMFIDGFDSICDYLGQSVHSGERRLLRWAQATYGKVADAYIQRLGKNS